MQKSYYGAEPNKDLDPNLLRRDIRPLRYRIKDFVANYSGWVLIIMGIMAGLIPFSEMPQISDFILVIGLFYYLYSRNKIRTYSFREPVTPDMDKKAAKNAGIMLIGNERENGAGVWFNNDDLRTHMLLFGSTGCGKSRTLLSLMYQCLVFGSGLMYVDGKADNTIAWLMFSIARRLGREDDFLVVNYLNSSTGTNKKGVSLTRLSNTTNPFAYGDAESLRSLVVGLMRGGDNGGDMWKGRASAMIGALLKTLVYLRNRGDIILDVSKIREYLPLDKIVELVDDKTIPESAIGPLVKYLKELPGFSEEDAMMGSIQAKAYEQHGYIIMQFSEVMSNLSDTYGHIFSAPMGEVDFVDVVFNRRILFVMLPSIGVDPDSLAGLGKLIIASVRSALSPALGDKLEGSKTEVIDTKPTNSNVPFVLCLDEYGYYAVQGFAVVAAQARSLGVSVIFAGQDYPSFKKSDTIEAQATVANTNIKIVMKLEDAEETYNVVKARAGQAVQMTADRFEAGGMSGAYRDGLSTRSEKVDRLAIEDLVDQDAGQGFVIFRNLVRPINMFFCDPKEVEDAELNKFLMVRPPDQKTIKSLKGGEKRLREIFGLEQAEAAEAITLSTDKGIVDFVEDYKALRKRNESSNEASIAAVGLIALKDKAVDREFIRKAGLEVELGLVDIEENLRGEIEKTINESSKSDSSIALSDVEKSVLNKAKHIEEESSNLTNEMQDLMSFDDEEFNANLPADSEDWGSDEIEAISNDMLSLLGADDDLELPSTSKEVIEESSVKQVEEKESAIQIDENKLTADADMAAKAKETSDKILRIFEDAVLEVNEIDDDSTIADKNDVLPEAQISSISDLMGEDEDDVLSDLASLTEGLSDYPEHPVTRKRNDNDIKEHVFKVMEKISKKED